MAGIEVRGRALRFGCAAVVSGLAASVLALFPGQARACSCVEPRANVLRVGTGQIPSNAAGVPWWFPNDSLRAVESFVSLHRWDGAELRPVAVELEPFEGLYLIRPAAPWSEGERYRISIDVGAEAAAAEERFGIVELEVGKPLDSGMLTLWREQAQHAELLLLDRGGSCAGTFDADFVDIGVSWQLPDWNPGILFFETYVDGQRWQPAEHLCDPIEPGTSWRGRGVDRIVADCSGAATSEVSVGQGRHTVRIQARLPGTDVVFVSDELSLGPFCDGITPGSVPRLTSPQPPAPTPEEAPGPAKVPVMEPVASPRAAARPTRGCALSDSSGARRTFGMAAALLSLVLAGARRRLRPP